MNPTALWTAAEAVAATGGTSTADWRCGGISIDSRTAHRGDLFVALKGPNFDGHDYLDAPPHRFQLAAHGLAAIDGYDSYAGVLPEFRQLAFDLDG